MPVDTTKKITLDGVRAGISYLESLIRINAGYQATTESRALFLRDCQKDIAELAGRIRAMRGVKNEK